MKSRSALDFSKTRLAGVVIGGVLVIVAAVVYGLASDPDAVHRLGASQLGLLGVALLVYLGAGIWAWKRRGVEPEAALGTGAGMGLLFGVAGVANLTLEYLGDLRPPFNAIVPATQMGVMVVLFGAAATLALRRSRPVASRAPGSRLERRRRHVADLRLRFSAATGGPADHEASGSLGNTMDSAVQHHGDRAGRRGHGGGALAIAATLLAPISARPRVQARPGAPGTSFRWRPGCALLVFAASLARAQRPPFVMAGMLLTAAALACAPAVLRIRARRKPMPHAPRSLSTSSASMSRPASTSRRMKRPKRGEGRRGQPDRASRQDREGGEPLQCPRGAPSVRSTTSRPL